MSGSVKTQGSKLFLVDVVSSSNPAIVAMECPTGIKGLGGASDQLDDTCLDDTDDKSFVRGLGNPGPGHRALQHEAAGHVAAGAVGHEGSRRQVTTG